jgi:hypothetical protein
MKLNSPKNLNLIEEEQFHKKIKKLDSLEKN